MHTYVEENMNTASIEGKKGILCVDSQVNSLSFNLCVKGHGRYNQVVETMRIRRELWRKNCVCLGRKRAQRSLMH